MKDFKYLDSVKVQNESLESQELSMFKGLSKDAEKDETENSSWTVPQAAKEYREAKEEYKKTGSEESKKKMEALKEVVDGALKEAIAVYQNLDEKKKKLQYNEGREGRVPGYDQAAKELQMWKTLKNEVGNNIDRAFKAMNKKQKV